MYRIKNKKKTHRNDRFALIAGMGESVFHTQDLANIWQIRDANTLYTTLKRYHQKGLLHRIHKGLYALQPVERIDPFLLGIKAVRGYAYVSTETVLAREGIIFQRVPYMTLVGPRSKKFSIGAHRYFVRKLPDQYLHNPLGVEDHGGVKSANLTRAVSDMLYFNHSAYFDAAHLIDWKAVQRIQKQIGYPLTRERYK